MNIDTNMMFLILALGLAIGQERLRANGSVPGCYSIKFVVTMRQMYIGKPDSKCKLSVFSQ
jgi:hypothetical protein